MLGMGGLFLWIWFMVNQEGAELKNQVQTVADRKVFARQFSDLTKTVEATAVEREELEAFILTDDGDTIALLSEFDRIAVGHDVDLVTKELTVETTKGEFDQLVLKYHLVGSEVAVFKMIQIFETLPYHGEINGLTINREISEDTGEIEVTATVSLLLSIKKYD